MSNLFYIFLGGGLGASSRWLLASFLARTIPGNFPWGILACNFLGSFLIGVCAIFLNQRQAWMSPFFITGYLGAFTTFSTFAFDSNRLLSSGQFPLALCNVLGNVGLALVGVWVGLKVVS